MTTTVAGEPRAATVDVIVPSFRRPDALKRALASVEEVRAATESWADVRVQVVDESEGSGDGPSAARNRAVAKGSAEFLAFLDDDDLWLPRRLDAAIATLQARDDVGLVCGDAKLASGGLFLGSERRRGDHHHRDLTLDSFVCTSTVTMRRAEWDAAGGMDESVRLAEDYDLYLRVTRYGLRIHVMDEILAVYTDTGEGIGRDCGMMAAATLDALSRSGFPGFTKDEPNWARRLGILNGAAAHWVMRERGDFAEGRRLALLAVGGAPQDNRGTHHEGFVKMYEWSGSTWVQMGADIVGASDDDKSGESVSLSSDGSRVAVGAPYNDGGGYRAGEARVYEWTNSAWVQMGQEVYGESYNDQSGTTVSLSGDGTRLAVGAPYNDGAGSNAGHVRVYEWSYPSLCMSPDNSTNLALGKPVTASSYYGGSTYRPQNAVDGNGNCGYSNTDCNQYHNDQSKCDAQYYCTFCDAEDWCERSNLCECNSYWQANYVSPHEHEWFQIDLGSEQPLCSVKIQWQNSHGDGTYELQASSDGSIWTTLSTGHHSPSDTYVNSHSFPLGASGRYFRFYAADDHMITGSYRYRSVYTFNVYAPLNGTRWASTRPMWVQMGADIDGEAAYQNARGSNNDEKGAPVSLSSDGSRLAVGAPTNDGGGPEAGHVRVYEWNSTAWAQMGADIDWD